VLGDMGEVGEAGPAYHREVGEYARARGIGALYALGEASRESAAAFGEGARHFDSPEALAQALPAAATVLVKGSRFMRMERVVGALTGAAGGRH
jgi:UDP-N-acetylmuramoyl-tripeptide--D-alanyl-D-alanine ligase